MKNFIILFTVFLYTVIFASAAEIGIDTETFKETDDACEIKPQLSIIDYACIEGLSHFGASLFCTNPKLAADRLLVALSQDPCSSRILAFLLQNFRNYDVPEKQLRDFIAIAGANPRALSLNVAALILIDSVNDRERKKLELKRTLAENCIAANDPGKLLPDEIGLFENIVKILSVIYLRQKEYEKGDELFDKLFTSEKIKNNETVLRQALIFYTHAARNADKSRRYLWLLPSRASQFAERKQELLAILQSRSTGKIKDEALINHLAFLQKLNLVKQARELLLEQLASAPEKPLLLEALAEQYASEEKYSLAAAVWQKIARKNPGDSFSRLKLARSLYSAKLYSRSADIYREILKILPPEEHISVIFMLALCELQLGNFEIADKLIATLPDRMPFWEIKAHLASVAGKDKVAFALLSKLVALPEKPDKRIYFFWLAEALKSQSRETQLNCLRIMKDRLDTTDAETANAIGYTYADLNVNLPEAKKLIESALKKKDCPEHLDSMAWVLYRQGNFEAAAEFIKRAIDDSKSEYPDAVLADHAGDIFHALKADEKALKYWKTALIIYSFDLDKEKVLRKIKELEVKLK